MKKRLNFITLLIGIAIGIIVMNSEGVSLLKLSFAEGLREGQNSAQEVIETGKTKNKLMVLYLEPIANNLPSELLNKKNGNIVPASINLTMVKVPMDTEQGLNIYWEFLCSVIYFSGIIMIIFNFIRIIIAVNKSVIFAWANVKRLRRIGIGFFIMFIINAIMIYNQNSLASEILEIENYNIINSSIDGSILFIGMISFLVAEIFAVGLRLREEQELTI